MTISRKERMLHIIQQLQQHTPEMSASLQSNLSQAKSKLTQMDQLEVEKQSDNVFSKPASETQIDFNTPENLLHATYNELQQLEIEHTGNTAFHKALSEFRHYFTIEEKDGFFP